MASVLYVAAPAAVAGRKRAFLAREPLRHVAIAGWGQQRLRHELHATS